MCTYGLARYCGRIGGGSEDVSTVRDDVPLDHVWRERVKSCQ